MAVGPSHAPMMAMETACPRPNPKASASSNVRKIPNCPAAPKISTLGFASIGPKSIIAPKPIKSRQGKSSVKIPDL